jgi:cell wall-associated NlpC family hydrolase
MLAIVVLLIGGSLFPWGRHAGAVAPVAALFAVSGAIGAFVGDAPVEDGGKTTISGTLRFGQPAPAPARTGVTTDDNVNLRTGPGTSYSVIAQLPRGTTLEVLGQQAGWYRVATARGTVGWVVADYFNLGGQTSAAVSAKPAQGVNGMIIDDGVHLRAGPGTSYASHGKLAAETEVTVLAREGSWYKVRSPRGTIGWASSEFVALDTAATHLAGGTSVAPATATNDVARFAQRYLGARYIWGGASPSGFDCSGFTMYIYRQFGVRLPRKANQQFNTRYGQRIVTIGALKPGDLVYFERTTEDSGVTHAGIYVGGGRMIAARSERLGVRYVSLYEPFWNTRFVGGLRPYR